MAHNSKNNLEQCWFCEQYIYRLESDEDGQPLSVPVDQELQKAYLFCQQPKEARPFSRPLFWTSAPKRAHPKCRDRARMWIETGPASPDKLGEKVKNFWEMSPQEQQELRQKFKRL